MYWVYILESADLSWYIGYTANLDRRIAQHNSGNGAKTTSKKTDWKIIYCEGYLSKQDAMGREKYLKSGSGRKYITKQLAHYLGA